ncbi:MAG: FHA domain-containing protein [Gammaproteobacteria bacterium]|nr:FHA domain-containing protein [Gammaproteobacteria bacterium]
MCIFPDAEKAVLALSALHADTASQPIRGHRISLHSGINCGSVILDGTDVYGTIVNVAAYLAATARAEQILTTHAVVNQLSPPTASCSRAIYSTKLKGDERESIIYEIIWQTDRAGITDLNLGKRELPADEGALLLSTDDASLRVDPTRARIQLGRDPSNALAVVDHLASRNHATIEFENMRFRLIDHSANGTFVAFDGSPGEVQVLRGETQLYGSGRISLGRSLSDPQARPIAFSRDKRSLYRV